MSTEYRMDDDESSTRPWAPGDPDRRKTSRSLLELTGTEAADHLPGPDTRHEDGTSAGSPPKP